MFVLATVDITELGLKNKQLLFNKIYNHFVNATKIQSHKNIQTYTSIKSGNNSISNRNSSLICYR